MAIDFDHGSNREVAVAGGRPYRTYADPGPLEEIGWAMVLAPVFLLWVFSSRHKPEEERRAEENRRKARRLYEEAFSAGDFSVIDEVIAEGFFDRLGQRCGPEGFKRSVAGLRRTFPDLRVTVEEQSAQGDTVTTRCTLCGMDRGALVPAYQQTRRLCGDLH